MKPVTTIVATALCSLLTAGAFAAGTAVSPKLDPQPEPPAPVNVVKAKKKATLPVEKKAINPQPEPPGIVKSSKPKLGEKVGLNPQPEPPAQIQKTVK